MDLDNRILLVLLGLYCVFYTLVILFNPNHYTTIDSYYYLESALHLQTGLGYTYQTTNGNVWNTHFPPFYSITITLLSSITGFPVLITSKIINGLAALGIVWVAYTYWGARVAISITCWLLSGTVLKIFVHTWSEALFLFLLTVVVIAIERKHYVLLLIGGVLLIMTRYIGVCLIPVLLFRAYYDKQSRAWYIGNCLVWLSVLGVWAYMNQEITGFTFGATRFEYPISIGQNSTELIIGLLNELLIFRRYKLGEWLWMLGLLVQILILFFYRRQVIGVLSSIEVKYSIWAALGTSYLVTLFVLRQATPFTTPNSRLLLPFMYCLLMHVVVTYSAYFKRSSVVIWVLIILLTWLELFPSGNWQGKLGWYIN